MILHRSIVAVTLVVLNGALAAQSVYRCGQTYQDSPCPNGKTLNVSDERSEEQRESARSVAEKEAARGDTLERNRLAQEKARRLAGATNIGPQAKAAKRAIEHRPAAKPHVKKKAPKARLPTKNQ